MKGLLLSVVSLFVITTIAFSQDEGAVVKRERIQLDKGIFVGGGVSSVFGSNFGDYSTGINFEGGYLKRLNRVLSIGGSLSYLSFKYDPSILQAPPANGQDPANFYYGTQNNVLVGFLLDLKGADITITSLAFNIKLNFIPVKDNSVFSVYGFAKPFISSAKRSDLSADAAIYTYDQNASDWTYYGNQPDSYAGDSKITGGVFLGPGIEFFPGKQFSFFAQAAVGYTFPIEVVSTRSYPNTLSVLDSGSTFPMKSIGFTSINFSAGVSFNLD